jgi:hypothetical protein
MIVVTLPQLLVTGEQSWWERHCIRFVVLFPRSSRAQVEGMDAMRIAA